jgi:UDP-N-acetylglucosamine diphosphorylase/glucosamine-1-phosphate N-acetyltransferase
MTNIIFFDDKSVRENLLPITYTRPTALLRVGITTIAEKWTAMLGESEYSYYTVDYLRVKFSIKTADDNLMIAGHVIPDEALVSEISNLQQGEALATGDNEIIAFRGKVEDFEKRNFGKTIQTAITPVAIHFLYDIFRLNKTVMKDDFLRITKNRKSEPLSATNRIIGNLEFEDGTSKIFIEKGASVEGALLNLNKGPIYIGKDVEIMEGACIRAPFAACENAKVRMGAKVYGATTLGPYCKVGGEIENTVMIGYSNKAHDGFLGDAVIGEWCNIGGGTTASNLKNDYSEIKLWNYPTHRFLRTGLQFCGLFMGDHCKTGVNCMINTGTVLGVGVNIHGAGFPRNFVASFMEGGNTSGFTDVSLTRFFDIASRVMARRGIELTDADKAIFTAIYHNAENYK